MFDYTGYECKSCGKNFSQDDDIVVCPECGTPYHRECYKREGRCISTALHEGHGSWREEAEAGKEKPMEKCKACGGLIGETQLFCDKCGAPTSYFFRTNGAYKPEEGTESEVNRTTSAEDMGTAASETVYPFLINFSDPLCGFNPEEQYGDGLTMKDMGDFVNTNTHYYLPKFRNMKNLNFKLSLNLPAMIFPEIFFANRKMPAAALLVMILRTIINFPATVMNFQAYLNEMQKTEEYWALYTKIFPTFEKIAALNLTGGPFLKLYNFTNVLEMATIFIFAGFSNYFYYRHALSKAARIKKAAIAGGRNPSFELRQGGGTSAALLLTFVVLYFVMQAASMAAVMLLV